MADNRHYIIKWKLVTQIRLELQSSDRTTQKTPLRNRTVLKWTVMSHIVLRHCSRQCHQKRHSWNEFSLMLEEGGGGHNL